MGGDKWRSLVQVATEENSLKETCMSLLSVLATVFNEYRDNTSKRQNFNVLVQQARLSCGQKHQKTQTGRRRIAKRR